MLGTMVIGNPKYIQTELYYILNMRNIERWESTTIEILLEIQLCIQIILLIVKI